MVGAIHRRQEQCKILRGLRIVCPLCTDCGCFSCTSPTVQHTVLDLRSGSECPLPGQLGIWHAGVRSAGSDVAEHCTFRGTFAFTARQLSAAGIAGAILMTFLMLVAVLSAGTEVSKKGFEAWRLVTVTLPMFVRGRLLRRCVTRMDGALAGCLVP